MIGSPESEAVAPPLLRSVHVRRAPDDAFRLFTDCIGEWWPLRRHGLFHDETAGVRFEGDRVVERSTSGDQGVWAEVVEWSPPHRLVLAWHPGQPPAEATLVEVDFIGDEDGTRVEVTHRGWEALGDRAGEARESYGGGWRTVLAEFVASADAD